MENIPKFSTPVAMEVTEEQYSRDLKEPLKELGYEEESMSRSILLHTYLMTDWGGGCHKLGMVISRSEVYKPLIPNYNPKLFLALAAMTEGNEWTVGEWLSYKDPEAVRGEANVFKMAEFKGSDLPAGYANLSNTEIYRKTTKIELIKHFGDVPTKTETLGENNVTPTYTDNRFPMGISSSQAQLIIDNACSDWAKKLSMLWAYDIVLGNTIFVDKALYLQGREVTNTKQGLLLDTIFGKDESHIPKGTACLVRDSEKDFWKLSYSEGNGKFYTEGENTPLHWKFAVILDINNLPER
ncbi:hypothetical protein KAU11_10560 [Candidatus Babeliales bacterium]|nr:hypothetical protein [Candidatus Babeliales bacterium]